MLSESLNPPFVDEIFPAKTNTKSSPEALIQKGFSSPEGNLLPSLGLSCWGNSTQPASLALGQPPTHETMPATAARCRRAQCCTARGHGAAQWARCCTPRGHGAAHPGHGAAHPGHGAAHPAGRDTLVGPSPCQLSRSGACSCSWALRPPPAAVLGLLGMEPLLPVAVWFPSRFLLHTQFKHKAASLVKWELWAPLLLPCFLFRDSLVFPTLIFYHYVAAIITDLESQLGF